MWRLPTLVQASPRNAKNTSLTTSCFRPLHPCFLVAGKEDEGHPCPCPFLAGGPCLQCEHSIYSLEKKLHSACLCLS